MLSPVNGPAATGAHPLQDAIGAQLLEAAHRRLAVVPGEGVVAVDAKEGDLPRGHEQGREGLSVTRIALHVLGDVRFFALLLPQEELRDDVLERGVPFGLVVTPHPDAPR